MYVYVCSKFLSMFFRFFFILIICEFFPLFLFLLKVETWIGRWRVCSWSRKKGSRFWRSQEWVGRGTKKRGIGRITSITCPPGFAQQADNARWTQRRKKGPVSFVPCNRGLWELVQTQERVQLSGHVAMTHTASRGNQLLWVLPTPPHPAAGSLVTFSSFPLHHHPFHVLGMGRWPTSMVDDESSSSSRARPLTGYSFSLSFSLSLCWSDARSEKHLQTTTLWLSLSPSGQNQILGSSAQTQPLLVSSGKIHKVGIYGRHKQAAEIQGLLHWQFQQLAYCSDN